MITIDNATPLNTSEEALIRLYQPYIKIKVRAILNRIRKCKLDFKDLLQAGNIGLFACIRAYDPTFTNPFKNYADFRIEGNMVDELRKVDMFPTLLRSKKKTAMIYINFYSRKTADKMSDPEWIDPLNRIYFEQLRESLIKEIDLLNVSNRYKEIFKKYYFDSSEPHMEDIAALYGVSESRVSQICKNIVSRIRMSVTLER
jgi:RNA polymerase sigma factor (sigma-70 family)